MFKPGQIWVVSSKDGPVFCEDFHRQPVFLVRGTHLVVLEAFDLNTPFLDTPRPPAWEIRFLTSKGRKVRVTYRSESAVDRNMFELLVDA